MPNLMSKKASDNNLVGFSPGRLDWVFKRPAVRMFIRVMKNICKNDGIAAFGRTRGVFLCAEPETDSACLLCTGGVVLGQIFAS